MHPVSQSSLVNTSQFSFSSCQICSCTTATAPHHAPASQQTGHFSCLVDQGTCCARILGMPSIFSELTSILFKVTLVMTCFRHPAAQRSLLPQLWWWSHPSSRLECSHCVQRLIYTLVCWSWLWSDHGLLLLTVWCLDTWARLAT